MDITFTKTCRGFLIGEFQDVFDVACTIQESSLASEPAIWIGPNDANPRYLSPAIGWTSLPVPAGADFTTRMHLTQPMVASLLPHLQHFVRHGDLNLQVKPDDRCVLTRVESFLSGFVGCEMQEGIPELMANVTRAIILLHRCLDTLGNEEDPVKDEHQDLINDLRQFMGAQ